MRNKGYVKLIKFLNPKIYLFFFLLLISKCTSTVEYIPEADFSSVNPNFTKKSPDEIEVYLSKPKFPHQIEGLVKIRSFGKDLLWKEIEKPLQKELFERKIDGVYFSEKQENMEINGFVFKSENSAGMVISYWQQEGEMGYWVGYPFRRKENGRKYKKIR